jgi:RNA polymerase sigma factor (sigma-70 family)
VVRVSGNLAIDTWRKHRRVDTVDGETVEQARGASTTPGPDPQRIDLHRALRRLSRRQREVLVLRFLADLPEADVARALGCSVGSVKQHASRGLAALRTTIGPQAEVPS